MGSFHFGKYKGKTYEEVAQLDKNYLNWFYGTLDMNDPKYGASNKKAFDEISALLDGATINVGQRGKTASAPKKPFSPSAPAGTIGSMDQHILEILRMVKELHAKMNEAAPF